MDPNTCYLITLLCNESKILFRCALKTRSPEPVAYFMEPEGKKKLFDQLPKHVQSIGEIVYVEVLFEIHVCK